MSLSEQQQLFMKLLGELLMWIYAQPGLAVTGQDLYRSPEQASANAAAGTGISNSLHCDKLAIDLNLFIDGVYQTDSMAHQPLGDHWKSLHPLARWGGDFLDSSGYPKPDGNHYSLSRDGRA